MFVGVGSMKIVFVLTREDEMVVSNHISAFMKIHGKLRVFSFKNDS